jgi:hypothetical protein
VFTWAVFIRLVPTCYPHSFANPGLRSLGDSSVPHQFERVRYQRNGVGTFADAHEGIERRCSGAGPLFLGFQVADLSQGGKSSGANEYFRTAVTSWYYNEMTIVILNRAR